MRPPIPEKSIAFVDSCDLLSDQDIETSLGGPAKDGPGFAGWGCGWHRGAKDISIGFDRESRPLEPKEGERAITIGSRRAVQEIGIDNWPDACQVEMD